MPSFPALPRPLWSKPGDGSTYTGAQQIHVAAARASVDCGVYVDGKRLPGT